MSRAASIKRWPTLLLIILAMGGLPFRALTGASPVSGFPICRAGSPTPAPTHHPPAECDLCPLCLAATSHHDAIALPPLVPIVAPSRLPERIAWTLPDLGAGRAAVAPRHRARGPPKVA